MDEDEPTTTTNDDVQPIQTVTNMFYESDDDDDLEHEDATNLDDFPIDQPGDDVVVPISGAISETEDNFEDEPSAPATDMYMNNKELFAQLPSFSDAARSLHTASTVKKTIRRRMSKRQLGKTTSFGGDDDAADGGDGPSSMAPVETVDEIDEQGSMEVIRSLGAPMNQRKSFRKKLNAQNKSRKSRAKLSCWKLFKLRTAMSWKTFKDKTGEFVLALQLWRSPLKEVEGNFGNGVLSYFLFLRSLFFLNIFIFAIELLLVVPQELVNRNILKDYYQLDPNTTKYLIGTANLTRPTPTDYSNMTFSNQVLDFITGTWNTYCTWQVRFYL